MRKLNQEPSLNNTEDEQLKDEKTDELILHQIKKRKKENEVLKKLLNNLNASSKKQKNN